MPTYKLVYFDAMGRAELARLIFAEAGVEYEDKRVPGDQWPAYKPKTPFGQMPVLYVDGTPIAQSGAIFRYLAREFKQCGETSLEQAHVDMFAETFGDCFIKLPFMEKDPEKKKERVAEAFNKIGVVLNTVEERFQSSGGEYLVGKKLTYADILLMALFQALNHFDKTKMDAYPELTKLAEKVAKRPKIKTWIETRPQTAF